MTRNNSPPKKPRASPKTAKPQPITWTTTIAHTQHRWWWYAIVAWSGWALTLLFATTGAWSVALVTAVITIALLVVNIGKPRIWTVTISDGIIHIERPGHARFRYTIPLDRHRAFTVVAMPAGKRDQPQKAIVLLPKQKLQRAQMLVLPHDEHEADMIVQQLSGVLPYSESSGLLAADRVLTRLVAWVGIR